MCVYSFNKPVSNRSWWQSNTVTASQSSINKQLPNRTSPWLSDMQGYHYKCSYSDEWR